MAYNIVSVSDLVKHCMRFYEEHWGYIYGAYGQIWTQAAQNKTTDEQAKKYGQQWVGKHVIDCSGVWWLAMRELGSYMYHGSNTMWNKYCVDKGRLSKGKRTDGKELKVGSAIYTGIKDGDHNHVGIYIGDGMVLEAGGCQKGVILTKVSLAKWTCWGEMKYVDYDGSSSSSDSTIIPPTDTTVKLPTLRKGSRGSYVTLLQTQLLNRGYKLPKYGADGSLGDETVAAVKQFQQDWGLTADGIVGEKTWSMLETTIEKPNTYTVTMKGLTKDEAEEMLRLHPGEMVIEK